MASLEGKVALITGASRGIAAAVARGLADRGVGFGLGSAQRGRPRSRRGRAAPRNHRILETVFCPVTESSWR
jgi:NAD(P)-dependent dehydrogenase (short-subunit alcohol dehydrogenase family)